MLAKDLWSDKDLTWILEFKNGSTVQCGTFEKVIEFLKVRARGTKLCR